MKHIFKIYNKQMSIKIQKKLIKRITYFKEFYINYFFIKRNNDVTFKKDIVQLYVFKEK